MDDIQDGTTKGEHCPYCGEKIIYTKNKITGNMVPCRCKCEEKREEEEEKRRIEAERKNLIINAKYVKSLNKYDLLIIDDVGTERNTEYTLENIYWVIDERVSEGKPLIITTNTDVDKKENDGNFNRRRINSRIRNVCIPVDISNYNIREIMSKKYNETCAELFWNGGGSNGKDIVLINDIKFKGKRSINWDDVKEYLKESVGEFYTILETGDVIYIGADLPDEYTGSNDTYGLKGTNAKAKANASQGIGEMIEIATDSKFIINKKDKHKIDAANGWYRFDSRFALPVFDENGEIERYNVFHVFLIVRHDANGKKYLYDVIKTKKETSNPLSY